MPAPAAPPRADPAGGWCCNLVVGCDEPAEQSWPYVIGDADALAGVVALGGPWSATQVGDAVAVWACHGHMPDGEPHVCGGG